MVSIPLLVGVTATGCEQRDRGLRTDGGDVRMAPDGGMVVDRDATGPSSTGPDSGSAPGTDGGLCPPLAWDAPAAATHGTCSRDFPPCITAARGADETSACYERESEDCFDCMFGTLYRCAGEAGCDVAYGQVECCLDEACPAGEQTCIDRVLEDGGSCAALDTAMISCIQARVDDGTCPYVAAHCVAERDGAPPGGGGAGGDGSACSGDSSVSGTARGTRLHTRYAYAHDDSGGIGLFMTDVPFSSAPVGTRAIAVRLSPVAGQTNYTTYGGYLDCGLVELRASGWAGLTTGNCQMDVTTATFASAAGVCDGRITGTLEASFGGDTVMGIFNAPLPVAESELEGPLCRGRDGACTEHSHCCSGSCSRYIGTCN